jgi:copper chaperone CopZ
MTRRLITTVDAIGYENSAVGLAQQLSHRLGITHVEVNADSGTVAVDFDEQRVEPSDVDRLIAECGYHGFHGATSVPYRIGADRSKSYSVVRRSR